MADRAFSTVVQEVSPSVPGCPQPMVLREVRKAAIRVCERTLFWRYAQPEFTLSPGAYEYGYNKPINTDVHVVFDAMLNDFPLEKLTLEQALYIYPAWANLFSGETTESVWAGTTKKPLNTQQFNVDEFNPTSTVTITDAATADGSEPRSICQLTPDKYIVLPLPDTDKTYTIRMLYALKPKRNADGMDEHILDELEDVIVHGALQQLLVLPNVAWSDRELASYHARQFAFMIAERRARANLSNMRAPMLVRFPTFA
jgi:hypothetical protein